MPQVGLKIVLGLHGLVDNTFRASAAMSSVSFWNGRRIDLTFPEDGVVYTCGTSGESSTADEVVE